MAISGVNPKCYILALFVRDDGARFLLGDDPFEFKDNQLHFQQNTMANDVVEVQGNDGYLLAGQVRRPGTQMFDGYVCNGTNSKEEVEVKRRAFLQFFRRSHFYKVIYVFPNGTAIQRKQGFLVDDPTVQELYQQYPEYHVALNFEDVNYYTYEEDDQGHEIYAKEAIVPLARGGATGGLIWDSYGVVWEDPWSLPLSVSGVQFQILNNAGARAPIDNVKLYGDTYQQTYSGKNLYNATKAETTTNTLVWSADTSEISLNGSATSSVNLVLPNVSLSAGTYVCSLEVVSGTISSTSTGLNTYFTGTNITRTPSFFNLTNASPRNTFVITVSADTTDAHLYFYARTSESFNNVKVKYQIVSGSTADYDFEPYVGGIPAPNPDYPETVNVVTGEQTVTISDGGGQSATYKVDLTGKNIIDGSYDGITSFTRCTGERSGNGFKITSTGQSGAVYATISVPNYNEFLEKTVTLSYDGIGSNVNVSCYYLASDGKTPSSSYLNNISSGTSFTFPSSIPAGSTGVCLVFYSSVNNNTTYNNIQLELGSSPTSYESHYDYELCKIGNYQDYIYKSGDDWYVHKECGKAVFNGTESWNGGTSTGSPTYLYAYTTVLDSLNLYSVRQAFCSHFSIWSNQLATGTSVPYPCMSVVTPAAGTYAHIRLMIPLAIATNTNELKTWLGSHNTNLYYVLATPTDTQITDATLVGQLEALDATRLFIGENNVLVSTPEPNLPATLSFDYYTKFAAIGAEWEEGGTKGATIVDVDAIDNTYPVWELTGPATNPTLSVLTTNTALTYNGTITASQKLVIDMFNKTATLNGTSVIGNISGDFVYMAPGTNRLAYTAGNTDAPDSTIYWQEVVG